MSESKSIEDILWLIRFRANRIDCKRCCHSGDWPSDKNYPKTKFMRHATSPRYMVCLGNAKAGEKPTCSLVVDVIEDTFLDGIQFNLSVLKPIIKCMLETRSASPKLISERLCASNTISPKALSKVVNKVALAIKFYMDERKPENEAKSSNRVAESHKNLESASAFDSPRKSKMRAVELSKVIVSYIALKKRDHRLALDTVLTSLMKNHP